MGQMDYSLKSAEKGLLDGDDLRFFYYDIFAKNDDSTTSVLEWSREITNYLCEQKLQINECDKDQMSDEYQEDKLFFTLDISKESKPQAFLRHLRNAFAHMNIQREGYYYLLKDKKGLSTTMIGKIKCQCLKEVCFLLFEQEEVYANMKNSDIIK